MITKPRNPVPTYRLHRRTGKAIITVRDASGNRRDLLLPGPFNSPESRQEFDRVLAILKSHHGCLPPSHSRHVDLTINEIALRFIKEHVTTYYVDPTTKRPTSEQDCIRAALRPLLRLFGNQPAIEFGPVNLRLVRDAMISGSWLTAEEQQLREKARRPLGLARTTINKLIVRIRSLFRWATEMQLIPPGILQGLMAVQGLRHGRSAARETEPVTPVSPEVVKKTLPFLPPIVRDMVELQLLSGMRAGEVCAMKSLEIDTTGHTWFYRPSKHKTQWRGHQRVMAIGPRGQAIVKKHLKSKVEAFLFSPAEQETIIRAEKRAKRKSRVQPSQLNRRNPDARRKPRDSFSVAGFNRAIRRACDRAGVPPWHSHQLRHTAALLIERQFGLDAARAALGHRTANVTAMYSGQDTEKAAQVMAKIG